MERKRIIFGALALVFIAITLSWLKLGSGVHFNDRDY
jgi:hypothetical protein